MNEGRRKRKGSIGKNEKKKMREKTRLAKPLTPGIRVHDKTKFIIGKKNNSHKKYHTYESTYSK